MMRRASHPRGCTCAFGCKLTMLAVCLFLLSTSCAASEPQLATISTNSTAAPKTLHIVVGRSLVLENGEVLRRIFVGNPNVLSSFNSSPKQVVLTAKAPGVSSVVLWTSGGESQLYTVFADIDPNGLRHALAQLYPVQSIKVDGVEDRLELSGTVPTQMIADDAGKLAQLYTTHVSNALRVVPVHGKQVRLKLRIVEVDRTRLEQFGVNLFAGQGGTVGSVGTQQFASNLNLASGAGQNTVSASDPLNLFVYNFTHGIGATVKDLEQRNLLQVLAEPTLTTLSGTPARFLSGGEFPFPVVQGTSGSSAAITIQFRPYGVKVDFTPTVNDDGTIHLKIGPEVSTLDYTNAVKISGFTIPAIATRRAETEVELRDGQSFALSGLLDHRTTESLAHVPGVASIPLLGDLFRSKDNNHSVTELVIIATVSVVDPLSSKSEVSQPKMAVPNLGSERFDRELNSERFVPKKR